MLCVLVFVFSLYMNSLISWKHMEMKYTSYLYKILDLNVIYDGSILFDFGIFKLKLKNEKKYNFWHDTWVQWSHLMLLFFYLLSNYTKTLWLNKLCV